MQKKHWPAHKARCKLAVDFFQNEALVNLLLVEAAAPNSDVLDQSRERFWVMEPLSEFHTAARDGDVATIARVLASVPRLDGIACLNTRFCLPDAVTVPGSRLLFVTALGAASQLGYAAIVRVLLAQNTVGLDYAAGVDAVCTGSCDSDRFWLTPLQLASKYGHPECVHELLRAGADVHVARPGHNSHTALALARALPESSHRTAVVALLQAAGAPEFVEPPSENEWLRIHGTFPVHWLA